LLNENIRSPTFITFDHSWKEYGYTHAVRIGNDLKISGAVSMMIRRLLLREIWNSKKIIVTCKILQHYGYSFDDVIAENVYITNMKEFIKAYFRNHTRSSFYGYMV
jgi:hypothetical protein